MNRIIFLGSVAFAFFAGATASRVLPQAQAANELTPMVIHVPDLAGDKLGNQFRKALVLAFRPSIFDDDVTALDVAEVAQTLAERADEIGLEGRGRVPEETDPVGPLLLSAQSKRRCERAGCKCDQHPSPHRH